MRAWAVVVVGLGGIGFGASGCTNKEAKVAEQERALASAKAETSTLRGTLPPIRSSPPKPSIGGNAKDFDF